MTKQLWMVWTALALSVACSEETRPLVGGDARVGDARADAALGEEPDAGAQPDAGPQPDAEPIACGDRLCEDGEACSASADCRPGSICNTADDPQFDPARPRGVCTLVVCRSDADCAPGDVCTPERVCRAPTCQTADDCDPGELCSAGQCVAPPPVDVCDVIGRPAFVREGTRVTLEARVRDASGRIIGGAPLVWRSSAPGRVRIEGSEAVGGAEVGVAEVTAAVAATMVACQGSIRIENVAPPAATDVRVRVLDAHEGGPLAGARVVVMAAGGMPHEGLTDAAGLVLLSGALDPIASVTVLAADREYVSVLSPGVRDLAIPLEHAPDPSQVGGFRGSVDVSGGTAGDMGLGVVGPALPNDLSRFSLLGFTGQDVPTLIDAPALGLHMQLTDMPGNAMLSLGNQRFTVDVRGSNLRCQGLDPPMTDLGCFVVAAPEGPGIGWTIARRAPLLEVSAMAGRLTAAMSMGGMSDMMLAMLPLFRAGTHGVAADLTTRAAPRVAADTGQPSAVCSDPATRLDDDRCRPDYSAFAETRLIADAPFTAHSVVSVPRLPRGPSGHPAPAVMVFAAASTGRRGLIPLGIGGGHDVGLGSSEVPDGVVEGAEQPFGPQSEALPDGTVALSVAPPHSGLEGSPLALVAVAFDMADSPADNVGRRFSGIVEPVARIGVTSGFGGRTFLGYATGVLDRSTSTLRDVVTPGAPSVVRIELVRGRKAWRIYAPTPQQTVVLPPVMEARIDLLGGAALPDMTLHMMQLRAPYADLFSMGSGTNLDRIGAITGAFSMQVCEPEVRAPCRVE